jgi:hypothetical protein
MGGMFTSCLQKEVKLTTPFGQCGCAESTCSCFGKAEEQDDMTKQIQAALRVEIAAVEHHMKQAILANIHKFGVIPHISVLDQAQSSPDPVMNTLTVRVKLPEYPLIEDEKKEEEEVINVAIKPIDVL